MSTKSDLFFKALAGKKAKMPRLDRFAEGGEAETPEPVEAPESDTSISDDEKLAAYEILEVMNGPSSDSKSRAERLAKALKAFFLIVDSKPHDEGGMPPADSGMTEPGPY